MLSPDDVAGLMKAPVTVSRAPGGTAWCGFTNDFSGDITMMIGSSENTEIFWHGAHIPDDKSTVVPLPGVGDDAVYTQNARGEIPEVAVKKGRVYCIVTYDAGTVDKYKMFKGAGGADLAKRLGALCTKSFAVFGA
ncbi:MAG: hypothetical protein ACRENC_19370 [Gemmatimonadaceae bacterium]